jgi:hypothetical protein
MRTPWLFLFVLLLIASPVSAGQLLWTPGGEVPTLVLSLGDGTIKKTLELPSGATEIRLTLRSFLLDDLRLVVTWKNGVDLWFRQAKKIPGAETTERVALPPGKNITLEVATQGGTSVALIRLRRN